MLLQGMAAANDQPADRTIRKTSGIDSRRFFRLTNRQINRCGRALMRA
jgi:hypothetical protein